MSVKLTKIFNGISWQDPDDILVYNGIAWESVKAVKVFNGISWETAWEPGGGETFYGNATMVYTLAQPQEVTVSIGSLEFYRYYQLDYPYTDDTLLEDIPLLEWPGQVYAVNSSLESISFETTISSLPSGLDDNAATIDLLINNQVSYTGLDFDRLSFDTVGSTDYVTCDLTDISLGGLMTYQNGNIVKGQANISVRVNSQWSSNSANVTYTFTSNNEITYSPNDNPAYRTDGVSRSDEYVFEPTTPHSSSINVFNIDDTYDHTTYGIDLLVYLVPDSRTDLLTGSNIASPPWLDWDSKIEFVAYNTSNANLFVVSSTTSTIGLINHSTYGDIPAVTGRVLYNDLRDAVTGHSLSTASFSIRSNITDGDGNVYKVYVDKYVTVNVADYNNDS